MPDIESMIDYRKIWTELYCEVTRLKSEAQFDAEIKGVGNAALTAYEKVLNLMNEKAGLVILEAIPGFDKLFQIGGNNDI